MKGLKLGIVGLMVLTLESLSVATANAQTQVTVMPTNLTVAGTHCLFQRCTLQNMLLLRSSDLITNLQVISRDLNRADGISLPAAVIRPKLTANQIKPNELFPVPIDFDLNDAPIGEFSGELLVNYQGGLKTVPVTVRVKAHWLWPLVVLIIGTVLGVGVSVYRSQGRPRDQVLVRAGQLRTQMQADVDLAKAKPFQSWVEACLVDVEMALQGERWEDGQNAVRQAETVWGKWRKGRADWLAQLTYRDELDRRLKELSPNTPYVQAAMRNLEDAVRNMPRLDGPDKLRNQLDALAQQLNCYARLQTKIKQLNELRMQLPNDEQGNQLRLKAQELERQMNELRPSDVLDDTNLQAKVEAAITEVTKLEADVASAIAEGTKLVSQHPEAEAIAKGLPKLGSILLPLAPAPSARPLTWEEKATGAGVRLRAFTWASYAIAVIFLAGAGFSQLYVDKPTFGANPWKDYFALLAWGFGAEATRDSIAKVVQGWGLPGLK